MKILRAILLLCGVFLAGNAQAQEGGAFGLVMGQPIASLTVVKRIKPHIMTVIVPKPNSEFEEYMVMATPADGVCKVMAFGKTHSSDEYGTEGKGAFNALHSALAARYGNAKDFDYLKYGSIWNEPRDYTMALYKKERHLSSFWDRNEGSNMPGTLHGIELELNGLNAGSTYVSLSYEFENFSSCKARVDAVDNSGL